MSQLAKGLALAWRRRDLARPRLTNPCRTHSGIAVTQPAQIQGVWATSTAGKHSPLGKRLLGRTGAAVGANGEP
jgi:hypothetical protein